MEEFPSLFFLVVFFSLSVVFEAIKETILASASRIYSLPTLCPFNSFSKILIFVAEKKNAWEGLTGIVERPELEGTPGSSNPTPGCAQDTPKPHRVPGSAVLELWRVWDGDPGVSKCLTTLWGKNLFPKPTPIPTLWHSSSPSFDPDTGLKSLINI